MREVMAKYNVVEIFESINGEGMHAGELAVFVRFRGCNLRCSYCDTRWACGWDAPCQQMTEEEICQKILETGIQNVTITGGEPLIQEDIIILLRRLAREKVLQVEVETNGSVSVAPFRDMEHPPVFTIDYKLPGSEMESRMCMENFRSVGEADTVKFVVSGESDLERSKEMIQEYDLPGRCHVILSPVYDKIQPERIVAYMRENHMNRVRLQLQMHKIIWDPEKRGV